MTNCWGQILCVFPKKQGWQLSLTNCWRCFSPPHQNSSWNHKCHCAMPELAVVTRFIRAFYPSNDPGHHIITISNFLNTLYMQLFTHLMPAIFSPSTIVGPSLIVTSPSPIWSALGLDDLLLPSYRPIGRGGPLDNS